MRLEFHPEAELELIEAAVYYEARVPGLGERFEAELRRAIDLLLDHPEIGSPANPDLRMFVLNRFPFTLYYSATPDVLRIEAVAHQRRRPGYWQSRMNR
ncbi:MAG: type II toxin-antitoxin system RelE/ParE family toxin [Nitrospirae bacterium]|nr:type II toxin-antitoxin system RelE/ParE family toxin [Nitrospirota bacterium]MBI3393436.1 type II toxin-antitoxin system RelE/ParE family toxin [Nitrospirota bacterium]